MVLVAVYVFVVIAFNFFTGVLPSFFHALSFFPSIFARHLQRFDAVGLLSCSRSTFGKYYPIGLERLVRTGTILEPFKARSAFEGPGAIQASPAREFAH
jgi:hypothetical protein